MNNRIVSKLNNFKVAIKNNRLSHLYLINGMKGSGKKELAYHVGSLLLNASVEDLKKGHINMFYIEPQGQNIRVAQIEALQMEFSKTSLVGGYRFFILDQVERLNASSANKLLKFLEEPLNEKTVGFLLTENIQQVIPTIQSRSQIINLSSPSETDLSSILKDKGLDELTSELLPILNKDIDELVSMSEDVNISMLIESFKGFIDALVKQESLWIYADENLRDIRYNKQLVEYFLKFLSIFYLDIFKLKNGQQITLPSFIGIYKDLKDLDNKYLLSKIEKIQEFLEKINYNINIDMAFSQLIIDIS